MAWFTAKLFYMKFDLSINCAKNLDKIDPLSSFRKEFYYPKTNGNDEGIYLCSNSLGLQPKSVLNHINTELNIWKEKGVLGQHDRWEHFHERLLETTSRLVGAKNTEVVVMNALTVNLHLLMISFYQPIGRKNKIIVESGAFPSDQYAIDSQVKLHGLDPKNVIIELEPRNGENSLRTEDIVNNIRSCADELSMVLMGGVNYYTGQVFDLKTITQEAHSVGAISGFDLAHAAGNILLDLHNWNVDFAAWCSYKYLCSGPGAPSGIFIHEKHHEWDGPRLQGWWGNDKATRFKMNRDFNPINSAEGWQISNAPILGMAPLIASMELFDRAGMDLIYNKGQNLSNYLYYLINEIFPEINIITPKDHGCQLSLVVENGRSVFNNLSDRGVVCDWREPDVIRFAPHPLFNSYLEIFDLVKFLKESINGSK